MLVGVNKSAYKLWLQREDDKMLLEYQKCACTCDIYMTFKEREMNT